MSAGTASPKTVVSGAKGVAGVASPMTAQQQQFLYTTIPNLGSGSNALSALSSATLSPAAQQGLLAANVSGTPTQQTMMNVQTRIQQSGWGLANANTQGSTQSTQSTQGGAGAAAGAGVIPTQN